MQNLMVFKVKQNKIKWVPHCITNQKLTGAVLNELLSVMLLMVPKMAFNIILLSFQFLEIAKKK